MFPVLTKSVQLRFVYILSYNFCANIYVGMLVISFMIISLTIEFLKFIVC